ncbi:Permease of the drug/metabolite transporter (DMT) superfamily [Vibrio chagasii]|uniref:DMT family transporter n=1 Tax=Vibrio chagasii TaxID=170679 RepID=UPI003374936A|nr:Permease of the drug/metabolite transporter (DMT) superfamily [Vibrio chagasii]CAH6985765.1 Permease of the drug/metabolite transporter (DMT) superfamily [Vibrio chagasii]CAH6989481.1 Permease of the drug/metabolite transporter (DMT) superfamily [Vibrio chagasii]CAH7322071.1 Permease of the drug/metabolite transporter (DMT) superfamily [Vibrio chagasii]CAH7359856.1 Permease of the drug/metabolite transporter (DMT) superfamily [Vibrio chagasii]
MNLAINRVNEFQTGTLAILFASILWGTTGTAASFAPDLSPLAVGAFSMGVGGLMQAGLAYRKVLFAFDKLLQNKRLLAVSALALAIYPLAFYSSMKLSGVAMGTVVSIATAPFFSALLECLISKDNNINKRWLTSFAIGVVGIGLLVFSESSVGSEPNDNLKLLGIGLGLVAGLCYAIYSWATKALIDQGIKSQAAMGSIFGLGAMLLLPTLWFTGDSLFASSTNIFVVSYLVLLPQCLGYIAFSFGLRHVTASSANLITLLEPVVAAVLAVWIVGERIPFVGWIGMLLIVTCLFIQSQPNDQRN